jgi:hypothetical protein
MKQREPIAFQFAGSGRWDLRWLIIDAETDEIFMFTHQNCDLISYAGMLSGPTPTVRLVFDHNGLVRSYFKVFEPFSDVCVGQGRCTKATAKLIVQILVNTSGEATQRVQPPQLSYFDIERQLETNAVDKNWAVCVELAKQLTSIAPNEAGAWIHYAYALHELRRTEEAYDVLSSVVARFPSEVMIHYNLGCYACQIGKLTEASSRLQKAIEIGGGDKIRIQALLDPDFAPLLRNE